MNVILDLSLTKLVDTSTVVTGSVVFNKVKNLSNWTYSGLTADNVYRLTIINSGGIAMMVIFRNAGTEQSPLPIPVATLTGNNILNVSILSQIGFEAEVTTESSISGLKSYFKSEVVTIYDIQEEDKTSFIVYRLLDEKDCMIKKVINVDFFTGKFKAPLGIKRIEVDMENYQIDETYNYVYIPKLKRYYYITDIQFMNNKFTRLLLQEDVLRSWQHVIRQQRAFITRYEGSTNKALVDVRRPLNDALVVSRIFPTYTTYGESKQNMNLASVDDQNIAVPNFMIVTRDKRDTTYSYGAITKSLDNTKLPDLAPHNSPNMNVYFTSYAYVENFVRACMKDDSAVSYLDTIIYLPFDPREAFNLNDIAKNNIYIGDKMLRYTDSTFVANTSPLTTAEQPYCTYETRETYRDVYQSAYLCIFDGTFEVSNEQWTDHEPYANYEINVPFVGLIHVNSYDVINQRILIYYSMDLKSGNATAFIFNYEKSYVIWSGTCQLGVKLDITSTNNLENTKQKQSADLNMALGLLSSALSIGIGIASENPVAIAGGVLSAGKTVASNVNTNRMLFSKAQTAYGSGDGSLYSPLEVVMKVTKNEALSINETVYKHLQGLPYNNYAYLYTIPEGSGYVEIGDIHFDPKGYDIYPTEIDEIIALLKNGVIF